MLPPKGVQMVADDLRSEPDGVYAVASITGGIACKLLEKLRKPEAAR